MLKAIGFTDEDLAKPLDRRRDDLDRDDAVQLSTSAGWPSSSRPGIRAAGGTPMEFNTISVSDGVSMGTEGMKALAGQPRGRRRLDRARRPRPPARRRSSASSAATRRSPGAAMALGRLDVPGLVLYNGTIYPGTYKGKRDATVVTVFEAIGAYRAGKITLDELYEIENAACPGAGRLRRPVHGQHDEHGDGVHRPVAGRPQRHPGRGSGQGRGGPALPASWSWTSSGATSGRRRSSPAPRSRTRSPRSPRPAARRTASSTCSRSPTSSGSRSTSTSSGRSPTGRRSSPTCSPGGRYTAADMYDAGGVGARHARAAQARTCSTATRGRSTAGRSPRSRRPPSRRPGQQVVVPIETPLKPIGGLAILRGSLAPDGCVVKLAGHERRQHRGPARVFDSETACYEAVRDRRIERRRRRRHPLRGPGRRPGHAGDAQRHRRRSSARASATRSRSSPTAASRGGTHGLMIGHVAPEAALGGPIAARRGGRRDRHRRRPQGARPRRPGRRARPAPGGAGRRRRRATGAGSWPSTRRSSARRRRAR